MWAYNNSPSLEHHGIKGQRWSVRRFQNTDGSLTAAGKKRCDNISPDKTRREMQKVVNAQRGERYGIGKNSDKVQAKKGIAYKDWMESDAYKNAVKNQKKLDMLYNDGKISVDDYDSQYHKVWNNAALSYIETLIRNSRKKTLD